MEDGLLTPEDVAGKIGVSKFTILKWAREDRIPSITISPKVIRFELEAVVEALKETESE